MRNSVIFNLFLDDIRFPEKANIFEKGKTLFELSGIKHEDWIIVRNYEEFVFVINQLGLPKVVSLDHDLHRSHMEYYFNFVQKYGVIDYNDLKVPTGKQCAEFLMEKWVEDGKPEIKAFVHSANPHGTQNIKNVVKEILAYD
jgi:hypothetical protein